MTLNSKLLSIVLLSGLTMGGTFARKKKTSTTGQDCSTEQWSATSCQTQCGTCPSQKICNTPRAIEVQITPDIQGGWVVSAPSEWVPVVGTNGNDATILVFPKGLAGTGDQLLFPFFTTTGGGSTVITVVNNPCKTGLTATQVTGFGPGIIGLEQFSFDFGPVSGNVLVKPEVGTSPEGFTTLRFPGAAGTVDCCPNACRDLCTSDCDSCKKQLDCCKDCKQILCFETGLSYEQTITPKTCFGTTTITVGGNPQPSNAKPNGFCGKLEVCFDKQLTQFCYRLTLCGADKIKIPNQQPTVGYFFSGVNACTDISVSGTPNNCNISSTFVSSWINAPVQITDNPTTGCGVKVPLICKSGCITQTDLERVATSTTTPNQSSVACIYQNALDDNLRFIVFGSSGCETNPSGKSYAFGTTAATLTGGVLAGNLRPCSRC